VIAHNTQAIQLDEELNGPLGAWSQRSHVAQTNNLIDTLPPYVGKHGTKSYVVAVDIRKQCDPHRFPRQPN
jgi:hypothetical protein